MNPSAWAFSISFYISASFFSSSIAFYLSAIFFMCLPMNPDGSVLSAGELPECKSSYYSEMISSRDCSFFFSGFFLEANFFNALVTLDLALVLEAREAVLFFLSVIFFSGLERFLIKGFWSFDLTSAVVLVAGDTFEVVFAVCFLDSVLLT